MSGHATDDGVRGRGAHPFGDTAARRHRPSTSSISAAQTIAARIATVNRLRPGMADNPALERLAGLAKQLLGTVSYGISILTPAQLFADGIDAVPVAPTGAASWVEALGTATALTGFPLLVPDARHDERVTRLRRGPADLGAFLGAPLLVSRGVVVGALYVYDQAPHRWAPGDVTLLEQLAASVVAELEFAALSVEYHDHQMIFGLAVEAARVGIFDWDLVSGQVTASAQTFALFGFAAVVPHAPVEMFLARLHPADRPKVADAIDTALRREVGFDLEYRVLLPGGALRWLQTRGQVFCDAAGQPIRLLGATHDTHDGKDAEARVTRVLEAMPAAFVSLDRGWRYTYVNAEAEHMLGMRRDQLLGECVWELFPAAVGSSFERYYRQAVESGEPVMFQEYYPAPLDIWFEIRAWPTEDGLSVYFLNITDRCRAQALAEQVTKRWVLLAEVTAELAETLDGEQAVGRLAERLVPALADWCIVTVVDLDAAPGSLKQFRDVGWWHDEPAGRARLDLYARLRRSALIQESLVEEVLRTGRTRLVEHQASEVLAARLAPGQARSALLELAPGSFAAFPLRGRGNLVGVLTLCNAAARGPFSADDLATAAEIAERAGMALDNAQLYQEQRYMAEALQRSLLSAPPESGAMEVCVRYVPAGHAAQVGGDWYDAFSQGDGATMLVIGDVVGHDVVAAAAMGQLRALLRGIAATSGEGPAQVLIRVDEVMDLLEVDTTATVVVARVEHSAEEQAAGRARLRWSNAGHPPPMLLRGDGTVEVLARPEADLLLGIDAATERQESTRDLSRGVTLLLYTDGLVERRGQSLDDGTAVLRQAFAELGGLPLPDLADALLTRLAGTGEDDVALVAMRLR